jgi:hypothetical protein
MFNAEPMQQQSTFFDRNPLWLKMCLLVMFLLAALIRRDDIKAPGHLLDREYTSAIFARAYYFMNNDQVEDWRRDIAVTAKNQQPVLEPPVLEYLVSLIYRAMGREEIYFARYLTSAFWIIGGYFLFLTARRWLSTSEALIATAYYLFVPMGVIISRSFQPDSLMMMLFLISLHALVLYFETPSSKRLIFAAVVASIVLLLRPLVVFAIFCAFLALSLHRSKSLKKLVDLPLILFSVTSLLPAAVYYGYGIVFAGFMRWKISTSFMPYLFVKSAFWLGWLDVGVSVAQVAFVVAAILGFFLLPRGSIRYLMVGLFISYILFGIAFTFHIHTHPYYHIQLFPIVGICAAPCIAGITRASKNSAGKIWPAAAMGSILVLMFFSHRTVSATFYQHHMESPSLAQEIGELVKHSPHTVYVAAYYGVPLEYYGEFGGAPWPVRIEDSFYRRPGEVELSVQQRLNDLGFVPDYFVVTDFDLFYRKHQDLQAYLESDCSLRSQTSKYLIYGDCKLLASK